MHKIELIDLKKHYGQGRNVVRAVDGVSLEIHPGEFSVVRWALRERQDHPARPGRPPPALDRGHRNHRRRQCGTAQRRAKPLDVSRAVVGDLDQ
jgi:hypothetical protein